MDTTRSAVEPVVHVSPIRGKEGVSLIEVEGELRAIDLGRWSALLRGAVVGGANDLVVDLRGCRTIDAACVASILAAEDDLQARRRGGVTLVVSPFSSFALRLKLFLGDDLPLNASLASALLGAGRAEPAPTRLTPRREIASVLSPSPAAFSRPTLGQDGDE